MKSEFLFIKKLILYWLCPRGIKVGLMIITGNSVFPVRTCFSYQKKGVRTLGISDRIILIILPHEDMRSVQVIHL